MEHFIDSKLYKKVFNDTNAIFEIKNSEHLTLFTIGNSF